MTNPTLRRMDRSLKLICCTEKTPASVGSLLSVCPAQDGGNGRGKQWWEASRIEPGHTAWESAMLTTQPQPPLFEAAQVQFELNLPLTLC